MNLNETLESIELTAPPEDLFRAQRKAVLSYISSYLRTRNDINEIVVLNYASCAYSLSLISDDEYNDIASVIQNDLTGSSACIIKLFDKDMCDKFCDGYDTAGSIHLHQVDLFSESSYFFAYQKDKTLRLADYAGAHAVVMAIESNITFSCIASFYAAIGALTADQLTEITKQLADDETPFARFFPPYIDFSDAISNNNEIKIVYPPIDSEEIELCS